MRVVANHAPEFLCGFPAPSGPLEDVAGHVPKTKVERPREVFVGSEGPKEPKRFSEALGLLRSFRTDERLARPFHLRLWYVTGDVLERDGRRGEAAEEFRRVVRYDPHAFDAAERLAALS